MYLKTENKAKLNLQYYNAQTLNYCFMYYLVVIEFVLVRFVEFTYKYI